MNLKLVFSPASAATSRSAAALPPPLSLAPHAGCMHWSDTNCCCPCCQYCLACRAMLATELKQRQQGVPQNQQQQQQQQQKSPKPQREASSLDATAVAPEQAPLERLGSTPGVATI